MKHWIAWALACFVCATWVGNEFVKWIRWESTLEKMQSREARLIEFMEQGDRFTLDDGHQLCESLADLQMELGRKPMNCEMLEQSQ